jgi:hypothetical protein
MSRKRRYTNTGIKQPKLKAPNYLPTGTKKLYYNGILSLFGVCLRKQGQKRLYTINIPNSQNAIIIYSLLVPIRLFETLGFGYLIDAY